MRKSFLGVSKATCCCFLWFFVLFCFFVFVFLFFLFFFLLLLLLYFKPISPAFFYIYFFNFLSFFLSFFLSTVQHDTTMLFLCYCYLGAAKRAVTNIVHKAKSDYFSAQIAQSNCCKELFGVCNELRGCNSGLSLPTALPVCDLPDAFADYFIRKVKTIRNELKIWA